MGSLEDDLTEYHRMNKRDEEIETLRKRVAELEEQTHNLREVVLLKARDAEQAEAQLAEAKERCRAAEELVLTPAGNIYAKLAEVKAELAGAKSLLVDKTYIQCKADYNRGHLSHANYLNERERAALAPSPAGREG